MDSKYFGEELILDRLQIGITLPTNSKGKALYFLLMTQTYHQNSKRAWDLRKTLSPMPHSSICSDYSFSMASAPLSVLAWLL
jgi:hypothetical protein